MKLTDKINLLIHPWMARYVCNTYNKKWLGARNDILNCLSRLMQK